MVSHMCINLLTFTFVYLFAINTCELTTELPETVTVHEKTEEIKNDSNLDTVTFKEKCYQLFKLNRNDEDLKQKLNRNDEDLKQKLNRNDEDLKQQDVAEAQTYGNEHDIKDFNQDVDFPHLKSSMILSQILLPNGRRMSVWYPGQVIAREREDVPTPPPTTTTTTTTTTTEQTPIPHQPIYEPIFTNKLKLIVPVTLTKPEPVSNYPWKLDHFAYLPPEMQPSMMNVPVHYRPTFHMIRALLIPNKTENENTN